MQTLCLVHIMLLQLLQNAKGVNSVLGCAYGT